MSGYSSYPSPPAPMSRNQEKSELQVLNQRFGDYIKKVEDARKQASQVDSSSLLNAIKNLENEIGVIKNLYEQELEKLRRDGVQAVAIEKQKNDAELKKLAAAVAELQQRLNAEQQNNRAFQDEIARLRQQLANKDQALNQAAAANNDLARQLDNAKKENEALKRNYQDVAGKSDKDNKALANAQEALVNLQKKSDFEKKLRDEEIAELKSASMTRGSKYCSWRPG
ncbi:cytotardin-like [Ptychodera flava]|uniref:cytotardin-like n=1 Tax=Ptychodera flava TaxID=63121 RepID=UPI003969BD7D